MKNAYDILGVKQDATDAEIRIAFREKTRVVHPDKNPSPTATKDYEELKKSYDILKDPVLREQHDFAIVRAAGASQPDDPIDQALADWFNVPTPHQQHQRRQAPPQPRRGTRHPHDRRMEDEAIPDGFLDDGFIGF